MRDGAAPGANPRRGHHRMLVAGITLVTVSTGAAGLFGDAPLFGRSVSSVALVPGHVGLCMVASAGAAILWNVRVSSFRVLSLFLVLLVLGSVTAVPRFFRGPSRSDFSDQAVENLRSINTALVTYMFMHEGRYAGIPELIDAGVLDGRFRDPVDGYRYAIGVGEVDGQTTYVATAIGAAADDALPHYYTSPDGIIRHLRGTHAGTPVGPAE